MAIALSSSPFAHGPNNVATVMLQVVYALIPAVAVHVWLFGPGILFNIVIASAVALASEAAVLAARARPVAPALTDGSALLTALLLAVAMPPLSPWWLVAVGSGFAIVFGKQLFGGLGFNPFNPAMLGYATLLISFPLEMTTWLAPLSLRSGELGLGAMLSYVFSGSLPAGLSLDTITGATPLDAVKTQLAIGRTLEEITGNPLFGRFAGSGREIVNGMYLVGGLWLIWKRVISWHVPGAMLATLFVLAALYHGFNPDHYAGPLFHLFAGGAMLGAFFIATDPISGATSTRGRIVFGIGVGAVAFVIRTWGGYPEGIAFAVLLMNMAAPTIDYYTQPRVYGHARGE
jgi:electron transport complex protein RnfD